MMGQSPITVLCLIMCVLGSAVRKVDSLPAAHAVVQDMESQLPTQGHAGMADLPPLLEFANGTTVTTMNDWLERREEMKSLLSHYYYG